MGSRTAKRNNGRLWRRFVIRFCCFLFLKATLRRDPLFCQPAVAPILSPWCSSQLRVFFTTVVLKHVKIVKLRLIGIFFGGTLLPRVIWGRMCIRFALVRILLLMLHLRREGRTQPSLFYDRFLFAFRSGTVGEE